MSKITENAIKNSFKTLFADGNRYPQGMLLSQRAFFMKIKKAQFTTF